MPEMQKKDVIAVLKKNKVNLLYGSNFNSPVSYGLLTNSNIGNWLSGFMDENRDIIKTITIDEFILGKEIEL